MNDLIVKICKERIEQIENRGDKYTAIWYELHETLQLAQMQEIEDCSFEAETGCNQGYVDEFEI